MTTKSELNILRKIFESLRSVLIQISRHCARLKKDNKVLKNTNEITTEKGANTMSKLGVTQKKYDTDFKIMAVHLASEIGVKPAAKRLDLSPNTLYPWIKAVRDGRLCTETAPATPDTGTSQMNPDVLSGVSVYILELERENRRLKEMLSFLINA